MKIENFKIQQNILLKNYTTFCIGGPAKYFVEVQTTDGLIKAVQFAQSKNLPYFILGRGSNVLFSDKGFDGVVIKNNCQQFKVENDIIYAASGLSLNKLLDVSTKHQLAGLEWAIGIPGTVGGAITGNTGAFNCSMAELIKEVEVLDKNLEIKKYKISDLNFNYRHSIFKNKNEIIVSVLLQFQKGNLKKSRQLIKKYRQIKKARQPLEFLSTGCIFKNPDQTTPAARLIDQSGLKGRQVGQAMISQKHANFIINLGPSLQQPDGAKSKDVIKLIELIKNKVKEKFNINLEEEIQIL